MEIKEAIAESKSFLAETIDITLHEQLVCRCVELSGILSSVAIPLMSASAVANLKKREVFAKLYLKYSDAELHGKKPTEKMKESYVESDAEYIESCMSAINTHADYKDVELLIGQLKQKAVSIMSLTKSDNKVI